MAQNEDRDTAKALRCWARAITTKAHDELRDVSCGERMQRTQNGGHHDLATPATRSSVVGTSEKQTSDLALNVAPGKQISDLPPPPAAEDGLSADGVSLAGQLEKLADERRKWMVTLYRATGRNSKRPADSKPLEKAQEWSPSKQRIVLAADFCCDCGKIVDARLESTAGGVFVAEHRVGCSSCENERQRGVL